MDSVLHAFTSNVILDTFIIVLPSHGKAEVYKLNNENDETYRNDPFGCRRWVKLGKILTVSRYEFG